MNPSETLQAILSLNNHQAWLAAWEIIRCRNEELKEHFVPEIENIRSAVLALPRPEVPALRDSRDCVKLALKIIEAVASGKCRCEVFETTDQILPKSEANHGMIEVLGKREIPWEPEFDCKCIECGQTYTAKENHGYHYPWSKWSKRST